MSDIILKEESYKIIGACMEVHRELGFGFKEIIYKDALINNFVLQTRNYLKASGIRLGIIAYFGESSFKSKRVVF